MFSDYKNTAAFNIQESPSPVTEQRDVPQAAPDIPTTSSWRQWYLALKNILPLYIAVHVAFLVTTVFSVLFILPDFSKRSLPLATLGQAWYRWDSKGYLAIAMHG